MKPLSASWAASSLILFVSFLVTLGFDPLEAMEVQPGKYKGKTGTTGLISFRVDRSSRTISKLNVSVFAPGQDIFGNFTQWNLMASNTDNKRFRLKRSGRFTASGIDANGIQYKVTGKLKGRKKFKGTAEMSMFRSFTDFDPFTGFFLNSELTQGSRPFTAK